MAVPDNGVTNEVSSYKTENNAITEHEGIRRILYCSRNQSSIADVVLAVLSLW